MKATKDDLNLVLAIRIAAHAHAGQRYNDEPYIYHSLRVMMMGVTDDERIVGVLHDVVEDSDQYSLERLYNFPFSEQIIIAIDALTRTENEPYDAYLERVKDNPLALAVKRNDVLDNYRHLPNVADLARRARLHNKYRHAMAVLGLDVTEGWKSY